MTTNRWTAWKDDTVNMVADTSGSIYAARLGWAAREGSRWTHIGSLSGAIARLVEAGYGETCGGDAVLLPYWNTVRTSLGRVMRDIERAVDREPLLAPVFADDLGKARIIYDQLQPQSGEQVTPSQRSSAIC